MEMEEPKMWEGLKVGMVVCVYDEQKKESLKRSVMLRRSGKESGSHEERGKSEWTLELPKRWSRDE